MKKEITILIPVFNVEKQISKCINSVLNQSFIDFELILIDDKSSDNSLKICKKFQNKDSRVKVISLPKNKGVDNARFTGIENSTGDYIMFVDSDDWLAPGAIKSLYNSITSNKADISVGAFKRVMDKYGLITSEPKNSYEGLKEGIIEKPELMDEYFISYFGVNKLLVNLWGKLYKKELFNHSEIERSGFIMGEDLILNLSIHPHLNKMSFVKDVVYYYRFGGMTSKANLTMFDDILSQYLIKKEAIEKYNYQKALKYARIEVKNVFFSQVTSLLRFETKESALLFIDSAFANPVFLECLSIYSETTTNSSDELIYAIKSHNNEQIIAFAQRNIKADRYKYFIKKTISKLLS